MQPAFAALHEMGFTRVRVLSIPTNLKTDWTDKGYRVDRRSEKRAAGAFSLPPLPLY